MAAVLLIEDDQQIRRLVAEALARGGHHVESASTAMEGLQTALSSSPDLILLDLGLPDISGKELLKMIRAVSAVPVIVVTAAGSDDVVVQMLDAGADDYLVKPFSTDNLEARVRAVLRRSTEVAGQGPIKVGDLELDVPARIARMQGEVLDLSPKEFELLALLASRSGQVVSKREMLSEVWRQPYGGGDRTVDVHISSLRRKLGESAAQPAYLHTVHGVGVRLEAPGD
jgi:DNA-binding response OmpR family regulator